VRLTSDGKIRTCLFSQVEHDLYGRLRTGASDAELAAYIVHTIAGKEARHHIGEPGFLKPSRSMVHIGRLRRGPLGTAYACSVEARALNILPENNISQNCQ